MFFVSRPWLSLYPSALDEGKEQWKSDPKVSYGLWLITCQYRLDSNKG